MEQLANFLEANQLPRTSHVRHGKEYWKQVFDDQEASVLSLSQYCSLHGFIKSTAFNWRKVFPRIAPTEVLLDALVASPEMLPVIAHAIMPTPLLWRDYGYQDDARGAGRAYLRSP